MKTLNFLVFILFVLVIESKCANILGVFPMKLKSHYIMFQSIMIELAKRGHNVTVINPFPLPNAQVNFTDIDVTECVELKDEVFGLDVARTFQSPFAQVDLLLSEGIRIYRQFMDCDITKTFLKTTDTYDLIITELFSGDAPLGFVKKFNSPHILFCAGPIYPWGADHMGNPSNPSYIPYPHIDEAFDRYHPTFYQRLYSTIVFMFAQTKYFYYSFHNEALINESFGPGGRTLREIVKKTSLILSFSHFSFNAPLPLVPGVIEIAGVHINEAKPLPNDIQKFIDESEHGVIYFCMGSLLRSETMPDEKRIAFLRAFSKVPQRVIWKWDGNLPGKTDKIFTSKWMPQRDILAHPKVKLFIAHGGALGLNEAIYEGVPVIGIPMYADQMSNLRVVQAYGAAEILNYYHINNDTVLSKIQQVLQPKYSTNMRKVSEVFKDRPMTPIDTAIYWIEYTIRHKGAEHLRSAAADMPLYQYLLLDVITFTLAVFISVIFMGFYLIKMCFSYVIRKFSVNSKKNK